MRRERLEQLLHEMGINEDRYRIVEAEGLEDIHKSLLMPKTDVAVCVSEYYDTVASMNLVRSKLGIPKFTVVVKPESQSRGEILSSTGVRQGLFDSKS